MNFQTDLKVQRVPWEGVVKCPLQKIPSFKNSRLDSLLESVHDSDNSLGSLMCPT